MHNQLLQLLKHNPGVDSAWLRDRMKIGNTKLYTLKREAGDTLFTRKHGQKLTWYTAEYAKENKLKIVIPNNQMSTDSVSTRAVTRSQLMLNKLMKPNLNYHGSGATF